MSRIERARGAGRVAVAALAATAAVIGVAAAPAAAGKPVPTITVASCVLGTDAQGFPNARITITWAAKGKKNDPANVEWDVTVTDASGSFTDPLGTRGLTADQLKTNTVVRDYVGFDAGAMVTVDVARWIDATGNVVTSSTNPPLLCQ
jgi:hypothetical protein